MSAKRSTLEIIKAIIEQLKKKSMSIHELERKVHTDHRTIKKNLKVLEFLGHVEIKHHKQHEKNNRPYTTARLKGDFKNYKEK